MESPVPERFIENHEIELKTDILHIVADKGGNTIFAGLLDGQVQVFELDSNKKCYTFLVMPH